MKKLEILDIKEVEYYYVWKHYYGEEYEEELKNKTEDELDIEDERNFYEIPEETQQLIINYAKENNIDFNPDWAYLFDDGEAEALGALIVLRDNETNTVLILDKDGYNHEGTCQGFSTIEEKISNADIPELINGLVKYGTKAVIDGNTVVFEPNENCWYDGCSDDELEEKLMEDGTNIFDIAIEKFKGKIAYISYDECGAIFNLEEVENMEDVMVETVINLMDFENMEEEEL